MESLKRALSEAERRTPAWTRVDPADRHVQVTAEWLAEQAQNPDVIRVVENYVPLGFDPKRDPYTSTTEAARAIAAAFVQELVNPTPVSACIECGNDDPCQGHDMCSDCLEEYGT